MKKLLLFFLIQIIVGLNVTSAQTPLAIITGFNEGGPDGIAIALVEDLPAGTRIYFTTEEYQAGQFKFADNTTGTVDEFVGYWESPTEVPEGMVIAISEVAPNVFSIECNNTGWFTFGVDCGSFTAVSGNFDINQEQELYLYSDNDTDPGNGITQMHNATYVNFAGNTDFPSQNNPGTPTGNYPYTFVVDKIPSVASPVKRFLNINGSGRFTNHIRAFLQRPSRWNSNDSFLSFTKLDTARFLQLNLDFCTFSTDIDGDLICDYDPQNVGIYTPDNCINTFNPDQADSDNDGIGDVCDATPEPIPALSEWGVFLFLLTMLALGLVAFINVQRQHALATVPGSISVTSRLHLPFDRNGFFQALKMTLGMVPLGFVFYLFRLGRNYCR